MNRKRAALLALAVAAAAAIAAVGASASHAKSKGSISLWTEFTAGGEKQGIADLIKAWDKQDTGISIKHRPIGNEAFFTVIRTGLAGSNPPDVLQYEGYQQTRDFAKAGKLVDLTAWWKKQSKNFDLSAAGTAACTYNGHVYCLPYTFATGWQIYYNADLLAKNKVSVPKNWNQFLVALEKLKQAGVTPISLGDKDGWPGEHWWMAFLVQRCGVVKIYQAIHKAGAKFTDRCFVQAAADFQGLQQKGYFGPGGASDDYGAAQSLFLAGKAAFFQTGSWFASGWQTQPPPFKAGIMPFPRFTNTKFSGDVTGAVTHVFGIPTKGKNREGALQFLTWLAGSQASTIWAKDGNMALYHGAVDKAAPDVIKRLYQNVKQAKRSLPWIENELPPGVGEDKVYNGTVALLTASMTPQQFAQSIQTALEAAK